jgi:hypothetical protein
MTLQNLTFGRVDRSVVDGRLRHLATAFWLIAWRIAGTLRLFLPMLYRSTERLCDRDAAVKNLTHSTSLYAGEETAQANPKISCTSVQERKESEAIPATICGILAPEHQ